MAVCRPKRSGFLGDEQHNYSDIIGWKGGIYSNIKTENPKGKKLGQDRCLARRRRRRRRKLAVNFSRLLAGDLADSQRAFASTPVTLSEPVLGQTASLFLSASCHGVSVCTVMQKIIHNPPWPSRQELSDRVTGFSEGGTCCTVRVGFRSRLLLTGRLIHPFIVASKQSGRFYKFPDKLLLF